MENTLIQHAAQINEAVSAMIELAGMQASNKERELRGESLAYNEGDFQGLLSTYELGHNNNVTKSIKFQL